MRNIDLIIKPTSIETVWQLSQKIPEFPDPYPLEEYRRRLVKNFLSTVALKGDRAVGFKVGYPWDSDTFYSWLGAVIPEERGQGIFKALTSYQEQWARQEGFKFIRLKTRNIHKRMLIFALSSGYVVVNFEPRENPDQHRIILQKTL